MNIILILLCIRGTIAGSLRTNHGHIKEKIPPKLSTFNQEHLDALQKEIKMLQETNEHAAAVELADTYRSRELIRDADRKEICFQDRKNYKAEADYFKDPFKANNDRGDWGKCLPEELFGILCEHEVPHMLNDGSWKKGDGPLHDELAEQLFLRMKSLHDKTCVHVDLDISDQVQEQFNDFLHARNKYAHTNIIGNGEITDVVLRVEAKGGKYFLNGIQNPELTFIAGVKYTFLTDGLENHPFKIGIAVNSPFETGVTYNSNNVTVQLPLDVSMTSLVYYCKFHSTMGNTIKVLAAPFTTYNVTTKEGKYYLNGMMTPEITLIRGETYKFDVSDSSVNTHPFRIGTRESTNIMTKNTNFEEAVTLSDKGYEVEFNITEEEFNNKFEACPVVQYTRNRRVHSVYMRTSPVPDNFNAYKLFTDMWSDTDNVLHDDFEIYDDKDDLLEGKGKWEFCNFNDKDVGYPRDCGKKKRVDHQWFSMPFGRHDAPGLEKGASFHIHSAGGCPSTLGPEVPYDKGVTYNNIGKEVIIDVPMDAPNMLTYYCGSHPGMLGNNMIVPTITYKSLMDSDTEPDDPKKITYDMACVQKYPNNPRFAMQMSLYCMTAFFSTGDVSTLLFDSSYNISSSCDTMMRMHERTLAPSPVHTPYAFCDQDVENDTCTVRAYVQPYIGRTCRSYCESFHGLTCVSANFVLDLNNGGKCLPGREMSCDAEHNNENHMLCTCTTDDEYAAKVGAPVITEEPLTLSATKLLVQPQSQLLLCDQNFINDTVKVFTAKHQSCDDFCMTAGLACFRGALSEHNTCLTKERYQGNECSQDRGNQLCTCGPAMEFDESLVVEAAANVPEASQYDLAYKIDVPNTVNFHNPVPYSTVPVVRDGLEFTRIAYYMQLIDHHGLTQWVWVSMDAFTNDITKIAIPTFSSEAIFQQEVSNLNIASNVGDIDGYNGVGNIEFWPNDYGATNEKNVEGASSGSYDWGDKRATHGSYGSMQVHAANLSSTIFAFNNWNRNEAVDIGIGNLHGGQPDWTFAKNGKHYILKRIEVFVKLPVTPTNAPTNSPTASSNKMDCTDITDKFCVKTGCSKPRTCEEWSEKNNKCSRDIIVKNNCPASCGLCLQSKSMTTAGGFLTDLVALHGTDIGVKTDVGDNAFNIAFAACPVVEYTRNEIVTAVYMRRTPIPDELNAYKLFTDTWESTNNLLNIDFELYDSKDDLINDEGKWRYCNYDEAGIGFPRDCGKDKLIGGRWFSMPGGHEAPNLKQGASFAVHSPEGCPIGTLVSRNNSTEVNNKACKRMSMQPHNGIKSYYGADRIIPNIPDSCTVESSILGYANSSCDGFCSTFKSMACVGAHNDPNAMFQDGKAVNCNTVHVNEFVACQCAMDANNLDEEKIHNAAPTSNACINLAFGGDLTSHEIYEYCDSKNSPDNTTCTVNVNNKDRTLTCSDFCSSHQGMTCLSASETNNYGERLKCESSSSIGCNNSSSANYLQCECGFVLGSDRADILKQGPVLEENSQEYCPPYTTIGDNDHSNEKERKYQKVTLTLGVDDSPEADGSIPVVAAKMVQDTSNENLDSYNTQDVEVCNGLEYTTREKDDPAETCSFGHRFDSQSNCYGKLEMSFEKASEKCAARGGHLLRLDNEDEFNKLNKVFRRQRFSIGLHSDNTTDGMEWDGYPGCKVDFAQDLNYLTIRGRNIKQDCWELNLNERTLAPHSCTDTRTWICEAHRPTETDEDKVACKNDSKLGGDGGDLMKDEGGFCLFYLEDPNLTLPDDESGGFRNTEIAHFLAFSQETRSRIYIEKYGELIGADLRGHYENDLNWDNLTRDKLGLNSTDYIVNIDHETDDFHCHFSPTNFGISRIYLQQHMLERIYPGAFKKHCFCGYKHLGKLVSRCDCTKNGVRNNNCQKEHRPMLYKSTYKENGEYVYCNNGQCDQRSP